MKLRITLLGVLITLFCASVHAQQIPNGGFEDWSSPTYPDNFADYESATNTTTNIFTFKDTEDKTEGTASVKLVTDTIPGQSSLGLFSGILVFGSGTVQSGHLVFGPGDFAGRPDTLSFDYKYSSPGNDAPGLIVEGYQATNPVFNGQLKLTPSTTWTRFTVLINYGSTTGDIDQFLIWFQSSINDAGTLPAVQGSELHVDNIHLGYNPFAGVADLKKELGLKVFPNPASAVLNVTSTKSLEKYKLNVFNLTGKLVLTKTLEGNANTTDFNELSSGTYLYRIMDNKNNLIDQNKISVIK